MFSLQARIIFPGHDTQGQAYAEVRPRPGTELVRLETRRNVPIVAFYGPALTADGLVDPLAAERPTLLYFYGNGMYLKAATHEFEQFRRLGLQRAGSGVRRLRDERRQPVRTRLPGHGRCGLRVPGRDTGDLAGADRPGRLVAGGRRCRSTSPRDTGSPV